MNETSTSKLVKLTRNELQQLVSADRRPSVSLYMPTHRMGSEVRQDPIRLKNLLNEAKEQLNALSLEERQIDELLSFATTLPQSEANEFWKRNSDGLAIFMQEGLACGYRVPVDFDELVVVAERFHIKPLFHYLQGDGHFYVLAVSSNSVRLFEGGKRGLSEVDTQVLPDSLADALNVDEYVSTLQFHSTGSPDDNAMFHGQGAGSDAYKKEELLKFFRKLDDGVNEFFDDESSPLVFAGVEYLFPIYQQSNNYRHLVETPVTGNQDEASADDLHAAAWKIVEPSFAADRKQLTEKFGTALSQEQATDKIDLAVKYAGEGRVETVLLAEGVREWGSIAGDGSVVHLDENSAESEDLLDAIAVRTLKSGGNVLIFDQKDMPTESAVAAMLRY